MPDRRTHRGPNPRDHLLFDDCQLPLLQAAVADYSLLLSMGYPITASLKLVGDHFRLQQRQRMAVARSSCTRAEAAARRQKEVGIGSVGDADVLEIDGFNLLITIESALSGGVIIIGRDGAYRDIASQHGTFHSVAETEPALLLIGQHLNDKHQIHWLLDRPVSNSGRLKGMMAEIAAQHGWNWQIDLLQNPDTALKQSSATIVSADSVILDHCQRWTNLSREIIRTAIPDARVIDLGGRDR